MVGVGKFPASNKIMIDSYNGIFQSWRGVVMTAFAYAGFWSHDGMRQARTHYSDKVNDYSKCAEMKLELNLQEWARLENNRFYIPQLLVGLAQIKAWRK